MGDLDWGPVIGGYAGLILLGASYASVGIMVSSWTKDQIVSILLGFFLCFGIFILDRLFTKSTGVTATVFEYLSSNFHFQNIARGVIQASDIAYYLGLIAVCLTLARNSIASRRW